MSGNEVDLTLEIDSHTYAICRMQPDVPVPGWLPTSGIISITRTLDELSIVCRDDAIVEGTQSESGWSCLRIAGSLDFSQVGILSRVSSCLAEAGISIFCISTFETDYFLVKEESLEQACQALTSNGMRVSNTSGLT